MSSNTWCDAHTVLICSLCTQVAGPGPLIPVCTGAEWYRFPSAFHLPGERYRLRFIKSGFSGLLPRQFEESEVSVGAPPFRLA